MTKDQAIALMIRLEGGFVDNPDDPGGATKYGITQRTLTAHRYDFSPPLVANVQDLEPITAAQIYSVVQWHNIAGDFLPGPVAALMLNTAINMGEPTAIGLLQECVGVASDYRLGPKTLAAVTNWKSKYQPDQTLGMEFAAHVAAHYAQLEAREGQFELGWFRRLFLVYTLAGS